MKAVRLGCLGLGGKGAFVLVWVVFAVLTAVAAIAVLLPYARARSHADDLVDDLGGSDAEVYKDQLAEIDKDVERGALSPAEADAARLEISRRLLKASDLPDQQETQASQPSRWRPRLVLATAFAIVPVSALALYFWFGAPGVPDNPLAERLSANVENQDVAILIARVEGAVQDNPDDARGWAILAPIYARQGRFFDARGAYQQLLRIEGEDPVLLTDLGEVIVVENQGLVTEEAMQQFLAALDLEPSFPKARYYRALGLVQEGRVDQARGILTALRNDGGPDAPWTASVDALLADMESAVRVPAPNADAAEAIRSLPEQERRAAIEGMVDGLAARLSDQPDDLAGWSQLVRSYVALGERADAERSLWTALAFFEADNPARLRLLTIAEELQLETTPP
ncbi:MAG: c-type cytochrome biogenesis protein CcmI [Rhizobiales bacterium]|nr:c-type cytochrome biogenesis protein CcmI [Hyphomicrobiales bacterium]MBO6911117.1 c-type cytochrome biogenesis protein CcmI [Hyphomicrobiales bacterium]